MLHQELDRPDLFALWRLVRVNNLVRMRCTVLAKVCRNLIFNSPYRAILLHNLRESRQGKAEDASDWMIRVVVAAFRKVVANLLNDRLA